MKKLIVTLFIVLMFKTGSVLAHAEHGKVSPKDAIQIAMKTTQQLTFKDFGFTVGKLNRNWKGLTVEDYKLYAAEANRYVVSASNKISEETIYFLMSMSGEVLKVNSEAKF
ncbi:MAG TPA: hypothetical protein DEO86_06270 [Colwellia sp.]|nr:hypothetical protein [Colwellia sp.]|tara:strand:+ start:1349 stop:1681 length:333 start_codon:yes stop_codon:yes gene_type:complete